ncbi:MAG: hypothetical protein ABI863_02155 [Ginsengibacter sp.]
MSCDEKQRSVEAGLYIKSSGKAFLVCGISPLLRELCSERMTSFPVNPQKNNSYTFHFEPWITEIFFRSFTLRNAGDHLEGKHPLLDDEEHDFKREK